jgi:hypothetical protein
MAKIFQQGHYANDMSVIIGANPLIQPLPLNNRAIIVTTQKSASEGKVYVIPITQAGIGTLDAANSLIYEGFGQVLDVIVIGY